MRFELDLPFSRDWKRAYLRTHKDGRKRIDLVNSKTERTTISYARYLVTVDRGEYLEDGYEVDHIDNDRTNDDLENLQILTKEEHRLKTCSENTTGRNTRVLECPMCGDSFEREVRQIKEGSLPKCSRSCNGKYNRLHNGWSKI